MFKKYLISIAVLFLIITLPNCSKPTQQNSDVNNNDDTSAALDRLAAELARQNNNQTPPSSTPPPENFYTTCRPADIPVTISGCMTHLDPGHIFLTDNSVFKQKFNAACDVYITKLQSSGELTTTLIAGIIAQNFDSTCNSHDTQGRCQGRLRNMQASLGDSLVTINNHQQQILQQKIAQDNNNAESWTQTKSTVCMEFFQDHAVKALKDAIMEDCKNYTKLPECDDQTSDPDPPP